MRLSYSQINEVYTCPHNRLNKLMGIQQPPNKYFENGKRLHRIIQDHVAGIKLDDRLKHLKLTFPIVETVDFDPKCKIEFQIDKENSILGYFDGVDFGNRRTLEIKTSSKKWSMGDFQKAMQRGVYCIALPMIEENVLIYAHSDDSLWHINKPKEFNAPVTKEHIAKTWAWLKEGVERIKNIKEVVRKELEETNGKCIDPRCYYGEFCQFK